MHRSIVGAIALVAIATLAACKRGPFLERGTRAGMKYEIETSSTEQLDGSDVYLTHYQGSWWTGTGQAHPLFMWGLENRGAEPVCAAVYYRVLRGLTEGEWGNGEPHLLQPGQNVVQAAGINGAKFNDYDAKVSTAFTAPRGGQCPPFESLDEVIPWSSVSSGERE